ncbi:MAG: hypothetical protein NVS9B6_03490 [Candidatus Limnocylindrales bacterium]
MSGSVVSGQRGVVAGAILLGILWSVGAIEHIPPPPAPHPPHRPPPPPPPHPRRRADTPRAAPPPPRRRRPAAVPGHHKRHPLMERALERGVHQDRFVRV